MRDESTLERCTVQILRQGLRANVLAGALAGKDMTASWPRAERLLSGYQVLHERREGHAKWSSLLHVCAWYVDRVFCDPRLLERSIFARSKHRAEREEEEHAHAFRRILHDFHDGGQFSPVDCGHRFDLRRRKDLRHARERVVLDVSGTNGKIEDLAKSHEHALERRLLAVFFNRLHGSDDEWGGDLVELTIADRLDDVALEASSLVQIAHDLGLFETTPETKSVLQYIPFWRLEPDVFSYASGFLSCLREIHVWVLAELFVGDTAR